MKTNKILLVLTLIVTTLFTSCEEQENVQFDTVNGQTLAQFEGTSSKIPVKPNETSTSDVSILLSTSSTADRVITVSVDESSTAVAGQYLISDFIVPAGEFIGKGTITGVYDELPEIGPVDLVLKLNGIDGSEAVIANDTFTVSMERFCAFDITNFYGTFTALEDGSLKYDVEISAGPVENTLTLTNLYDTNGTSIIELDNTDLSNPTVIIRSREFDAALYVSGTYGNVWANAFDSTTPSVFNVCAETITLNFRRTVSVGSFSGETNVVLSKK